MLRLRRPDLTQLFHISLHDLLIAGLAILAFLLFVPIFTYIYFANDLVDANTFTNKKDTGLILLDRNNQPFFSFYQARYQNDVPISQIPKLTQQALIASEDKDFYHHGGFSISSIIRSALADFHSNQLSQGGSTITQQLVRTSLLSNNKNFLRKFQEIVLASEIERRFSKDQILGMYLNSVYFGAGAFGIDEAAHTYFNTDAQHLDLAQSSLLVAVLPAPSQLSPLGGDLAEAKVRQTRVLEEMVEQGYITKTQAAQAEHEKLTFSNGNAQLSQLAPDFALMVRDQLVKKYGEEVVARSGFKVHTTLDLNIQAKAVAEVKKQVANIEKDGAHDGAAVVMDPKTGEILALVGSADWNNPDFGKINMATALRQPGSSFKPIVYSTALEEGVITPATILQDVPTTFPGGQGNPPYRPLDYDRRWRGPVTVRRALDNSLNVPAVEVLQKAGIPESLDMAKRLGITTLGGDPANYGLSLVLGTGGVDLVEMTDVYATFANQGNYNPPTMITSIEDKYNNTIYSYTPENSPVLDPAVAFLISSILSDNRTRAEEFGNTLTISRPAAVKTGTSEDFKDALTLGYTPSITVGVWVGNADDAAMDNVAGSLGAAPIWRDMMEYLLKGTQVENFTQPDGVVKETVCGAGMLEASTSARVEYFLDGTQPPAGCRPQSTPNPLATSAPSTSPSPVISPSPAHSQPAAPATATPEPKLPPGQTKKQ